MPEIRTSTDGLRWSRYARARERGGWTVAFHELHPEPFYLPTETWRLVRQAPESMPLLLAQQMRERSLLIAHEEEDDRKLAEARRDLNIRLDRATILYLVLVQGCNFTCSYCPIPALARKTGNVFMTSETVRAALDVWARHVEDDYSPEAEYCVIFYGGEPLMNEAGVFAGLEHVEGLQAAGRLPRDNLSLMVSTNGMLIEQRLARLFHDHGVSVVVGCDGPEEYHDRIRRDTDGRATFARVAAAIRTLVSEGVRTYASVAITPHNLQAIDHYSEFFDALGVEKFGFNFLRGRLLFSLVPRERLTEYYERATDGVVANYDNFGRHLEYQFERKHQALLERHFFPVDCNGYGNQLVVEPNGQIGNCPFIRGNMGDVHGVPEEFRIRRVPVVRAWRERLPLYSDQCQVCDAKSICGGGCAWNAAELKGDPLAIDDAMCLLTRKVFDRLIWYGAPSEDRA